MGSLVLLKIRDNYPDKLTSTFSVFPSPKVSDVVVEPYNAILSIHQLLENSDQTFVIDNEALFSISHNVLKQKEPKYEDLNFIISNVMSNITAPYRLPVTDQFRSCSDMKRLGVNLVTFPRLHFFLLSMAPLFKRNKKDDGINQLFVLRDPGWILYPYCRKMKILSQIPQDVMDLCCKYLEDQLMKNMLNVEELTDSIWCSPNFLANIKAEDGKYMSVICSYRGMVTEDDVSEEMLKIEDKLKNDFVSWIPNKIKPSIVQVPMEQCLTSGLLIGNTTAIKGVFQRISTQFAKMYKRKAFLHWYKGEGMDEMEFQEADKNVRDLITQYQDKQDAIVGLDDYEDNDGDESDYDDDEDDEDDDQDDEEEDF